VSKSRTCPVCGGTFRAGDNWDSFWTGRTACRACGAPLRLRRGWKELTVHNLLLLAGAAPVYLATHELPGLGAVAAFLALFLPVGIGLTALHQWYRWRYGALMPVAEAKGLAGDPGAAAEQSGPGRL
jgi:hypothetical protein